VLAAQAVTLALVARAAVLGEVGLGALIVYVNAVLQTQAFGSVTNDEITVQYGAAGLKPLAELERSVVEDARLVLPGTRPASGLPRASIRFERVRFTYPGRDEAVFRDLTLEIPTGRSLAIVGANGAGKTTLIKLLTRLYDPDEGAILVDGIDLREVDPRAWQRRVAAIFQDFVKFQLTAHDNVALGAPERQTDRAAVEAAARRAGALEVVEALSRGWDTILSRQYAGGADLSGGQWQRIGLARALFAASSGGVAALLPLAPDLAAVQLSHAGASILVMDEPTAHLDVRAEAAFYDSFLDVTQGLTTIVISHRFSTVRRADRIVVLEHGRVVEAGPHDALMACGGRYAEMFTLQAQRFAEAAPGGVPA
jgi:ATP-binding cassette subfamily B protein